MKLEQQVISLELAKSLKELGVKQESLFYYIAFENPLNTILSEFEVPDDLWWFKYSGDKYFGNEDYRISAFTVGELGGMLPCGIDGRDGEGYTLLSGKNYGESEGDIMIDGWGFWYEDKHNNIHDSFVTAEISEANARAKMLTYLLRNKLIKL